jgi:hypothetical protein
VSGVPASSRGFNGGTITAPLDVDLTGQSDAIALEIFGATGGSNDLLKITDAGGHAIVEVFQAAGKGGGMNIAPNDNASVPLTVDGSAAPSLTADVLQVFDKTGTRAIRVSAGGGLGFYGHAAQAQQTGVAVTAAAIHAALVNLGLITA